MIYIDVSSCSCVNWYDIPWVIQPAVVIWSLHSKGENSDSSFLLLLCFYLQLCELVWHTLGDATCSCNVVFTFQGGRTQTVLSKTVLIQHPTDNNRLLVCAGDETDSMVSCLYIQM